MAGQREPNARRLREGIADQFSYRGERSDIWRVFDILLETDAFLNLGYSDPYQPHVVGSCQRRLATVVGRAVSTRLGDPPGVHVLDLGCGRGGPAIHFADHFGFRVTGIDLVPYNVSRARENARGNTDVRFLVGDASALPVSADAMTACTSVDALVYMPDREAVFDEIARVLEPGGVLAFSDLVARADADRQDREAVAAFAGAWDMEPPASVPAYRAALREVGFDVLTVRDLTSHSVGRFRKWTTAYGWLRDSRLGQALDRVLASRQLDPDAIDAQIRRVHGALPALKHVLVVAKR